MKEPLRVLIAEDNPDDAELLLRALRKAGFAPEWQRVDTEVGFIGALHAGLDLVLSDYEMPQFTGLQALGLLKERHPDIPFIIISGTIGEDTAVAAMKEGASDYLLKDRLGRLGQAVTHALEQGRLLRERRQTEEALRESEARMRTVTDTAQVGMVIVTPEHRYRYANRAYAKLLRLPTHEIVGQLVADVLAPVYATQVRPRLERAFRGERIIYELTLSSSGCDPIDRHFAVAYEPGADSDDKVVVVVIMEITEQKRAEKEIKNQLQELRRWHEATLGREDRILELKREVNALLADQKMPLRYAPDLP
jgi:PAS domain S-box-containing protein